MSKISELQASNCNQFFTELTNYSISISTRHCSLQDLFLSIFMDHLSHKYQRKVEACEKDWNPALHSVAIQCNK